VVSSVDERIDRSWRHPALSSALVGVVLRLFLVMLGPAFNEWRLHLHQKGEAFRQSHNLGVRFNTAFSKLEPDRQRQVLELLQWQE
jgi:phosphopantetheinyl transferase